MPDNTLAAGGVFLSYAREDTDAARRIAEALRGFGVVVWFDQSELRGGDQWDAKIKKQIRECALFVPIVSAQTQERSEGYFRREWLLAVERTRDMAAGRAFIVPVVVDETAEDGAEVPEEFMRFQWVRLVNGEPTPEFVAQVKSLLEKPRKPALKPDLPRPPTLPPMFKEAALARKAAAASAPTVKSGVPGWTWGMVVAVAVGVGTALFLTLKPRPAAPTPPQVSASPSLSAPPVVADKSIAVLPFANMSPDKENEYFTDGVHEDILTNLALVRELRVVSRTSVLGYRGTTKPIREIARELGVAYILEGSVRRAGGKVRVTAQLIRAATDEHLWAKNYDRDLTDVFSIQTELATEIAGALKAALSPEEQQLLARRPTENLAAYDAYVKARQMREVSNNVLEIVPVLQDALTLDPGFAQAWAQMGSLHAFIYFNELDRSANRLAQAKAAIETAQRLAPDDPDVIEKTGDYYYYGFRDYERAAQQYQRLAVLRPNDAAVFGSLGFIHRRQGRFREALGELRHAVQLEPRTLRYVRTLAQLASGLNLYDEAVAVQERIVAQLPDLPSENFQLATYRYLAGGPLTDFQAALAQLKPTPQDAALPTEIRKQFARFGGDWETALRLRREQPYYEGFGEPHWSQDITAAFVLWRHGDTDAARALARSALAAGQAELARKPSATTWGALVNAHLVLGNNAEALRCAAAARDLVPESIDAVTGPPLSLSYAQTLAWTGDKDRALAELARLLRTPFGENPRTARVSSGWIPLRGDPRFEALLNDPKNLAPLVEP